MEAPRLTAVVVLPTPPFWFATARTLPMPGLKLRGGPVGRASVIGSAPNGVVLPTQRTLHRHPGPPRKALGRGRHLAKHVEMAVAGPREGLDRPNVIERHPHLGCGPLPQTQFAGANPPLPGNQHARR